MNDPEIITLKNRLLLGLGICFILLFPFFLFLFNKLNQDDSKIVRSIKKQDTFFLLVVDNKEGTSYKKELKNEKVKYRIVNAEKDKDYVNILKTLDIPKSDVIPPAVLYIEKGDLVSTYNNIQSEDEIKIFIENYKEGND